MLRARLMTATAAVALFTAPAAFAQDAVAPTPVAPPAAAAPTSTPVAPAAPAAQTTPAAPAPSATPAAANTIVDVLKSNGQFTTLLTALDAAQLTETLRTQPAISIFAPTDAAFAALPDAERTRLMDPANVNELRKLLLYHVVVADVNSSQIEGTKGGVQTAAETQVQLDGTAGAIKVDAATVTTADIDASNGAIFAIDKVLNPAASLVAAGDAEEATTEAAPADAPAADATEAAPMREGVDDGAMTPPAGEAAATPPPPAETAPAETAPAEMNAPSEPAASGATTASPPVVNPTDDQVDGEQSDMATDGAEDPAPAPTPQA